MSSVFRLPMRKQKHRKHSGSSLPLVPQGPRPSQFRKTLWESESDPSLSCPGIQILAFLHTDCRWPRAGHQPALCLSFPLCLMGTV